MENKTNGNAMSLLTWRIIARISGLSTIVYTVFLSIIGRMIKNNELPMAIMIPYILFYFSACVITGIMAKKLDRSYGWVIASLFSLGIPAFVLSFLPSRKAEDIEKKIGKEMAEHVRNLKSWANWALIWGLVNIAFSVIIWQGVKLDEINLAVPLEIFYLLMLLSALVVVAAVVCMASMVPWPGFYPIFSVYWVIIGFLNIAAGSKSFYLILGLLQVGFGVSSFIQGMKYSKLNKGD